MTDDEFNRLLADLTSGLPITIAMARLHLALRGAVEAGGAAGANFLRMYVAAGRRRDEGGDDAPPPAPPPPPRRR